MTEHELRALIRQSVARHLEPASAVPSVRDGASFGLATPPQAPSAEPQAFRGHASHYQYVALVNVGDACLIEPSVGCNHCGYCRSHGH